MARARLLNWGYLESRGWEGWDTRPIWTVHLHTRVYGPYRETLPTLPS